MALGAGMDAIVYESAPRRLRITRHASPPPGFVELLARTVWGTGAVRYTIRGVEECVAGFAGSHFLVLRERGDLVGTYVLAPRVVHAAGEAIPALYRTLLAVAPGRTGEGLGELLVTEARRWMLARAGGPFLTYGFIEAENAASLAVASRSGHERWGSFVAAPFTRGRPRDDPRVEQLAASVPDPPAQAVGFGAPGGPSAPSFVLREGDRVVAAASALEHRWALHGLGGLSGLVTRRVLPRLPGLRYLDPDDLRFAFFGSVRVAPGHDAELGRLLEAVLARRGLHAAMVYADPRGRVYRAVRRGGGFGLVHGLGVRPAVHVVGSAAGVGAEVGAALRALPFVPDVADHV